jgi:hypothetical protein
MIHYLSEKALSEPLTPELACLSMDMPDGNVRIGGHLYCMFDKGNFAVVYPKHHFPLSPRAAELRREREQDRGSVRDPPFACAFAMYAERFRGGDAFVVSTHSEINGVAIVMFDSVERMSEWFPMDHLDVMEMWDALDVAENDEERSELLRQCSMQGRCYKAVIHGWAAEGQIDIRGVHRPKWRNYHVVRLPLYWEHRRRVMERKAQVLVRKFVGILGDRAEMKKSHVAKLARIAADVEMYAPGLTFPMWYQI